MKKLFLVFLSTQAVYEIRERIFFTMSFINCIHIDNCELFYETSRKNFLTFYGQPLPLGLPPRPFDRQWRCVSRYISIV